MCPGHCYCRCFVQELLGLGSTAGRQSKEMSRPKRQCSYNSIGEDTGWQPGPAFSGQRFVAERVKMAWMENRQVTAGERAEQREQAAKLRSAASQGLQPSGGGFVPEDKE